MSLLYTCRAFNDGTGCEDCDQQARGPDEPGAPEGWAPPSGGHPNRWVRSYCGPCERERLRRRANLVVARTR